MVRISNSPDPPTDIRVQEMQRSTLACAIWSTVGLKQLNLILSDHSGLGHLAGSEGTRFKKREGALTRVGDAAARQRTKQQH